MGPRLPSIDTSCSCGSESSEVSSSLSGILLSPIERIN